MYSNKTLDCLKAAPTTTIFLPGINKARSIAYKESIKDLPKPREAISIGNFLPHISFSIKACVGSISTFSMCLHIKEKYSGLESIHVSLTGKSCSVCRLKGLINSDSSTDIFSQASLIMLEYSDCLFTFYYLRNFIKQKHGSFFCAFFISTE